MPILKEILIPVDNSGYSNYCIDFGIILAGKFKSKLIGNHVYAAKLHDQRFAQMESGLPPKYQEPKELEKQRGIHESLITRGLEVISHSFLDHFEKKCERAGVSFNRKMMEGKNYEQIVRDINESNYSLIIMGAFGLGALHRTSIGSVTSRVVRRSKVNVLVVRRSDKLDRKIVVAVDGSPQSFSAVKTCAVIARTFGVPLEGIAAFDPHFHVTAFRSIAEVLSEEAGRIFRFKEQEKLHDEIIDKGLKKIYQGHLETAKKIAAEKGVEMKTTLMAGRSVEKILEYVDGENPSLVAAGKIGIHSDNGLDLGSVSENLLINLKCNLLLVAEQYVPLKEACDGRDIKEIPWTQEALERTAGIPDFVRNMAKKAIYDYAVNNGCKEITREVVDDVRKQFMP